MENQEVAREEKEKEIEEASGDGGATMGE